MTRLLLSIALLCAPALAAHSCDAGYQLVGTFNAPAGQTGWTVLATDNGAECPTPVTGWAVVQCGTTGIYAVCEPLDQFTTHAIILESLVIQNKTTSVSFQAGLWLHGMQPHIRPSGRP
jgi:hypothetical protein